MRRRLGTVLIAAGIALAAWTLVTRLWQEPITAALNWHGQRQLGEQLHARMTRARLEPVSRSVRAAARAYRLRSHDGEAMGRIVIPRIGLNAVLVDGTSETDLAQGPGIYAGDYLPGEGRLVYVAGHRTTYGAPFSQLDLLRPGDPISIVLPYGSFVYRVTRHRIVAATAVSVLRSHRREQLILQTCHPRFSASHRYLVYAEPLRISPREQRR